MKCIGLLVISLIVRLVVVGQNVSLAALSITNQSNVMIDGKSFKTGGTLGASIYLSNCTNIKITNCDFILTKDIIGVQLQNCSNVEITGCYFNNFKTGVYAVKCTGGINIHCNTFDTIAGAKPRGQMVQFNSCSGTGNRINYNTLNSPVGMGAAEDIINLYASGGTVTDPIQVNGNQLRGGGPSTSGGGIMLGDNGSHDIICDGNVLVNPGQYGISVPSGKNIVIKNNKVYSSQFAWTNVGVYVGLSSEITAGFACEGATIQVINNQVNWTNKNGIKNGWYNCSCCSGVVQSGNNFNASITAAILPTKLVLNSTQCAVKPQAITQSIALHQGWNLLSFNVHPLDSSIASLFKNIDVLEIKSQTAYWRKGQNAIFNSLTALLTGSAYFAYVNTNATFTVTGTPMNSVNYSVVSNSGWNLIGCFDQAAVPMTKYFSTSNCKTIKNLEGFWMPGNLNSTITTIEPGKGYLIKN